MEGSGSPQPNKPTPPKRAKDAPRKPLQVMHISRRSEEAKNPQTDSGIVPPNSNENLQSNQTYSEDLKHQINKPFPQPKGPQGSSYQAREGEDEFGGVSMGDLLRNEDKSLIQEKNQFLKSSQRDYDQSFPSRSVDDFDFDEEAFLAALDENEPVGITGEVTKGSVIAIESDGVYVDIGGKAPGFMPKNECGLGVITNLKERFPKGLEVEVLVTRDQNADGMVTISCRALALRKSWDKVKDLAQAGQVVKVKINGFNRGGVTCDLEGLRGFIPRSQLEDGENHEKLVGKTLGTSFLEVNPETRKLVLSEKRASLIARFSQLEVGQLIEGEIVAIKPYGFFIDLGGVSGLLHHSMVTNGSLRTLREVFETGEKVKSIITELDPGRGRIGLNTALLEGPPGELLIEKEKVMAEADERAKKVRNLLTKPDEKNPE